MTQCDALPARPRARAERAVSNSLLVLIEVPESRASDSIRGQRRFTDRGHDYEWRPVNRRTKRRLRREVRVTGCALLAALPLMLVSTLLWQNDSGQVRAASFLKQASGDRSHTGALDRSEVVGRVGSSSVAARVPSVVVLSIEPAVSETEAAVVLPGYLLPDDSLEESANAGS